MYCKNCGKELNQNGEVCLNCGFAKGTGEKHCSSCGKEVLPGQALCVNCGFWLVPQNNVKRDSEDNLHNNLTTDTGIEKESAPNTTDKKSDADTQYRRYINRVKKSTAFKVISQSLQIVIILMLVFLPIYTCKYKPVVDTWEDLESAFEDIENFDELEEMLDNDGYITKNFSLFDDAKLVVEVFRSEEKIVTTPGVSNVMIGFCVGSFVFVEIFAACYYLIILIIELVKNARALSDLDTTTRMRYNRIKKPSLADINLADQLKSSQLHVTLVIIVAVMDVIFTKVLFSMDAQFFDSVKNLRYMSNLTGVSFGMIILLGLLICTIVMQNMMKSEEKKMRLDVANEK